MDNNEVRRTTSLYAAWSKDRVFMASDGRGRVLIGQDRGQMETFIRRNPETADFEVLEVGENSKPI